MSELTLGPLLFHWSPEKRRDFYYRIADEAPVTTVYLGEVICAKRLPMYESCLADVIDRLQRGQKTVVFSTLAEVMLDKERALVRDLCDSGFPVEANDATALRFLKGKSFRVGPFFNAYNEKTLEYLAANGATHLALNPELSRHSIAPLGESARILGVGLEVQAYGRAGLAVSARCYHARAFDRHKDNCQFVCETHPDGMVLNTLDDRPFLVVNGIETLSYTCTNLVSELDSLERAGVTAFRLSPQDCDMVSVAGNFRRVLDPVTATEELARAGLQAPFANGFYHKVEGFRWIPSPS